MALPLLFSFLGSGLAKSGVLGAAGSFLSNPLIAGAIGSGLGTLAETGDLRKALLGGLGSFAGGQLMGNVLGGAGGAAGAAGAAAPATFGGGTGTVTTGVNPLSMAAPTQAGGLFGGRMGDIARAGMEFGRSGQGIGAMLGGALGSGMVPDMAPKQRGGAGVPGQFNPMARTAQMPGEDFAPGMSPEFDYGVSTPYTQDYFSKYAPRGMAGGGMVQRMIPGYGAVPMQAGGIAEIGTEPMGPEGEMPNEREIISAAVAAIKGQHPQPEVALGAFLSAFGEEAFRDLVDRVQSGEMDQTAAESEGQLAGPGDGMSDMIPATIDGQQDVLLSDGEYIVPADVVSGLGNGSSDAGARALDNMAERVRTARTGRSEQAPAVPQERMIPA